MGRWRPRGDMPGAIDAILAPFAPRPRPDVALPALPPLPVVPRPPESGRAAGRGAVTPGQRSENTPRSPGEPLNRPLGGGRPAEQVNADGDTATFSRAAGQGASESTASGASGQSSGAAGEANGSGATGSGSGAGRGEGTAPNGEPLTAEEVREVERLRARDQEVRIHEQAHIAAAGPLFRGGPFFEFERGPDGVNYVVGGSVSVDTSPGRTPEETIQRARIVQRSALAPAEPSSTDRRVAAQAARQEAQARAELAEQRAGEASGAGGSAGGSGEPAGITTQSRITENTGASAFEVATGVSAAPPGVSSGSLRSPLIDIYA